MSIVEDSKGKCGDAVANLNVGELWYVLASLPLLRQKVRELSQSDEDCDHIKNIDSLYKKLKSI